ncbi:MAG: hypothetical protein ACREN8_02860 [Candidatus Dormibacteraceae bacterium]
MSKLRKAVASGSAALIVAGVMVITSAARFLPVANPEGIPPAGP